jgi:hypothetical protein
MRNEIHGGHGVSTLDEPFNILATIHTAIAEIYFNSHSLPSGTVEQNEEHAMLLLLRRHVSADRYHKSMQVHLVEFMTYRRRAQNICAIEGQLAAIRSEHSFIPSEELYQEWMYINFGYHASKAILDIAESLPQRDIEMESSVMTIMSNASGNISRLRNLVDKYGIGDAAATVRISVVAPSYRDNSVAIGLKSHSARLLLHIVSSKMFLRTVVDSIISTFTADFIDQFKEEKAIRIVDKQDIAALVSDLEKTKDEFLDEFQVPPDIQPWD